MSHSNTSLNCFNDCMKKYEHNYILHTPPCKEPSLHLTFGAMAHEVLYKAGMLRDEFRDGVSDEQYQTIIPSEVLYPELKNEFQIKVWDIYFRTCIKKIAAFEKQLIEEFDEPVTILREHKFSLSPELLFQKRGLTSLDQPLVGIIDLLLVSKRHATIIDYKFSTTRKGQDEFDMNSQLQLYAMAVHYLYNVPLRNIRIGYIDIPKKDFGTPTVLTNGLLSRATSQNVSQENYAKAVEELHGNDPYYNCKEGGYYYDIWCKLALNQPAYLVVHDLDIPTYEGITFDLLDTARMIDIMNKEKLPYCKKYDSYSCANCEFVKACKPWRTVQW